MTGIKFIPYAIRQDSLSVSGPFIHPQHQGLPEMINTISLGLTDNAAFLPARVLSDLDKCMDRHFAAEERLVDGTSYPVCGTHIEADEPMIAKMAELRMNFRAGTESILLESRYSEGLVERPRNEDGSAARPIPSNERY